MLDGFWLALGAFGARLALLLLIFGVGAVFLFFGDRRR